MSGADSESCAVLSNASHARCAEITVCEADQRVQVETPSATPNDPLYAQQWNFKAINMQRAWATGQYGDPQKRVSTISPFTDTQYVTILHSCARAEYLDPCIMRRAGISAHSSSVAWSAFAT